MAKEAFKKLCLLAAMWTWFCEKDWLNSMCRMCYCTAVNLGNWGKEKRTRLNLLNGEDSFQFLF